MAVTELEVVALIVGALTFEEAVMTVARTLVVKTAFAA